MAAEPVPVPEPEPEPEPMYGDCGMDVVPQEWQHGHMGALPRPELPEVRDRCER